MQKKLLLVWLALGLSAEAMEQHQTEKKRNRHEMAVELDQSIKWFERDLDGSILGAFVGETSRAWFGGDTVKTIKVLHSLLAKPDCNWEPTKRAIDLTFLSALRKRDVVAARAALNEGANPNCYTEGGGTPLSIVVGNSSPGQIPLLELLLEKGADPRMPFATSWTPLACATHAFSCYKSEDVDPLKRIKMLVAKGARMQISTLGDSRGLSPVSEFYGNMAECVPAVQFLLSYVAPEEVELLKNGQASKEQVVADIIETKKLLLTMDRPGANLRFNGGEGQNKPILDALSIGKFDAHYKDAIIKNVELLLEAQ